MGGQLCHLVNLHLSSHPNITMCWSFVWGDLVSPERDLPDSREGGVGTDASLREPCQNQAGGG